LFSKFEDLLILGLSQCIEILIAWIIKILKTTQKKDDYLSKKQDVTTACSSVCSYIMENFYLIQKSLDGRNLESFLIEFASRVKDVVLNHLKDYRIGESGSIIIVMDFQHYRETFGSWGLPAIDHTFSVLSYLEKIYFMDELTLQTYLDTVPHELISQETLSALIKHKFH